MLDVNYFWGAYSETPNGIKGFTDENIDHMIDTFEWISVADIPIENPSGLVNSECCNYVAYYNIPSSNISAVNGDMYIVRASIDGYPCSDSMFLSLTDSAYMLPDKTWVGVLPYQDSHQFYNDGKVIEICSFDASCISLRSSNQKTLLLREVIKSVYPYLKENCNRYFEKNVRIFAAEIVYLPFGNIDPEINNDGTYKDVVFEPYWAIYYQTGIGKEGGFNRQTILINAITGEGVWPKK